MATIVVDYGGRVEELQLMSPSQGKLRDVLLTHNGNATAIMANEYWKGMLLVPWANRIAYVSAELSPIIPWCLILHFLLLHRDF